MDNEEKIKELEEKNAFTLFDFFILGLCPILNLQGCKVIPM